MAVVITENRLVWTEADAEDWTEGQSVTLFTTAPTPKELTGSLGFQVSEDNLYAADTSTSQNLSAGVLLYAWIYTQGSIDNTTTGGVQIVLSDDGTNVIGYHVAGSDKAGFRHDIGEVNWQCQILDTANLPATYTEHVGTEGNLDLSAITIIGVGASVASKSIGGADNVFADIIYVGNDGIIITGGGSGTEGNFDEIAVTDADNTSLASSWGICREVAAGVFGLQGPLIFGDNAGTGSIDFYATDEIVSFEDRSIGTDKYYITVTGNSTGTTSFQLGTQVGAAYLGQDGCTLSCPVGVGAYFDASNVDVDYILLYGSTFAGLNAGMDFSADATNGPNHEIYGNSFVGCAQIDPGKTNFKGNSVSDSTDSATGSILLDVDGTGAWEDLSFTSGGTGHAIYITEPGTYTFTNFIYSNFGADDTTDAEVYNDSGDLVTINVLGGDSPSVRNGSGASTDINNTVTLEIHVVDVDGNDVETAQVAIYKTSDDSELMNKDSDVDGLAEEDFNYTVETPIYWRVRKSSVGDTRYFPRNGTGTIIGTGFSSTITLTEDDIVA